MALSKNSQLFSKNLLGFLWDLRRVLVVLLCFLGSSFFVLFGSQSHLPVCGLMKPSSLQVTIFQFFPFGSWMQISDCPVLHFPRSSGANSGSWHFSLIIFVMLNFSRGGISFSEAERLNEFPRFSITNESLSKADIFQILS